MRLGGGQHEDSSTSRDSNKLNSTLKKPIDSLKSELLSTNSCKFLPKLYDFWRDTSEINFDKLPQSFALKTNHDCGGVVLVPDKEAFLRDKSAFQNAMQKLESHLATNYYKLYREWHYNDIEPRVFAEELLGINDSSLGNHSADSANFGHSQGLQSLASYPKFAENHESKTTNTRIIDSRDSRKNSSDLTKNYCVPENFRIFVFPQNGAFKAFIQVDDAEYWATKKRYFYNAQWIFQPFSYNMPILHDAIPKPKNLALMLEIARILAFDFVRVDLYALDSQIFVGELTFTPCGGDAKWNPSKFDKFLGDLWI